MILEHEAEPIRGLPGNLPADEHIIWQGGPDWRVFARSALFTRYLALYFGALALFGFATGSFVGALATLVAGALGIGLMMLFAWGVGKTTVYTLTNKRLVLRIGVALSKCVNLPLGQIGSADLRSLGGAHGDVAMQLTGKHRLGYAVLWPHARPWKIGTVEPMLRALPDAEAFAAHLSKAVADITPIDRTGRAADTAAAMTAGRGALA